MKNFKFKWLLLSIVLSIASINTAKAWYVKSTIDGWVHHNMGGTGGEKTYWNVAAGTYYYHMTSDETGNKGTVSGSDCLQNASTWDDHKSLQSSDFGMEGEQMKITIPENSNITFKVHGNWQLDVYVRPAYYFKYDWNGGTWAWCGFLDRCGDGTYATEGKYRSTCTSFNYDTKDQGSGTGAGSCSTIYTSGSPSGDANSFFIYDPDIANSGANRSLTIVEKNSTSGHNYMYFDNTNAGWGDANIQFVLGHLSYSRTLTMSKVGASDYTNLYYVDRNGNDWTGDNKNLFGYFGMIGSATKWKDDPWNSNSMYNANHYSKPLFKHQNLQSGYIYMISKDNNTNGDPITIEEKTNSYTCLNFNLTIQYAISDNGGAYNPMSSGKTPATITGTSYKFTANTTVASTTLTNAMTVNTTQYSTTLNSGYTGKTVLTVSNVRPGYKFVGWYDGNTLLSTNTTFNTYRPTQAKTITARFQKLYGYVEGRFRVYNQARGTRTSVGSQGVWTTNSAYIKMSYDEANDQFILHTYSTPDELKAAFTGGTGDADPYFFIKTSTSSTTISSGTGDGPSEYWASADGNANRQLTGVGEANRKGVAKSEYSLTFVGNSTGVDGYVILYCNGSYIWYELEQTLNYASNGGSGAAPAEAYHMKNSTTSAAAANTFTAPTGYHFDHWAGSNSTNYNAGATVTMSANLTLTAQWAKNNFTVTFNANGGDGEMDDQAFEYSTTQYLTANAFTKDGYYFVGWATDAEGDASIQNRANGSTLTTENNGTVELFAKWESVASIASDCWDKNGDYTCGDIVDLSTPDPNMAETTWKDATWGDGSQTPTINSQVVIPAGVKITVDVTNAQAKEVILGSGATLTIEEGKALVIAETLTKNGAATGENDVVIKSTLKAGLGALVIGENDGSNKASVNFATRSHGSSGSSASVNQYLGTLYSSGTVLNTFYNSWVYKLGDSGHGWTRLNGSEILTPFKGYAVISADAEGHVYENDGALVASVDQEINLNYNGKENTENMLANSWSAPMLIRGFDVDDSDEETDFYNVDPTIYIFNSGSKDDVDKLREDEVAEEGVSLTSPGQWIVLPIGSSPWVSPTVTVIPAMQSFSVYATGASPKIKLNYQRLVYNPAVNGTAAVVGNRAPKRVSAEDPDVMKVIVEGESGYRDHTVLLAREDFTDGYDAAWDGRKVYGTSAAPQLYAMSEDGEMAVNCSPELDGTILCFEKGNEDSQYTFMFTYDGDETLYLNDVKDQTSTLISEENTYSFTSAEGDKEARFVISKTPIHNMPTGIETVSESAKARKQMIHGTLYIIRDGRMYNAEGALVK